MKTNTPVLAVLDAAAVPQTIITSRVVSDTARETIWLARPLSQCSFGSLAEACARLGISQLWVIGDHPEDQINYSPEVWPEWDLRPTRAAPWVHAVKLHSDAQVDLVFPGLDDPRNCPFTAVRDAAELLSALTLLRTLLNGQQWHRSGGATAARLLRGLHTAPRALPLELGMPFDEWPAPATDTNTEETLAWVAPLPVQASLMEMAGYVHAYDKNGAYLAATAGLKVGAGKVVHTGAYAAPVDGVDARVLRPGYYLVDVDRLKPTVEEGIPAWSGHRPRNGGGVWVTLPTVQLMVDRGEAPVIYESYTWEAHHRPLQTWYELLRDARAALMPGGRVAGAPGAELALAAVKATYRAFLGGYLASTGEARDWDRSHDTLYRPDMRHAVMAVARTNMIRRVEKVAAEYGDTPLAIGGIDTVFYASADPWPLRFAAKHLPSLPVGDPSLKGWSYKGTAQLTPELRETLAHYAGTTQAHKATGALFKALRRVTDEDQEEEAQA